MGLVNGKPESIRLDNVLDINNVYSALIDLNDSYSSEKTYICNEEIEKNDPICFDLEGKVIKSSQIQTDSKFNFGISKNKSIADGEISLYHNFELITIIDATFIIGSDVFITLSGYSTSVNLNAGEIVSSVGTAISTDTFIYRKTENILIE